MTFPDHKCRFGGVLVTGGAGFIGSHLVDALVEVGHEVRVFDNCSTGSRDNLAHLEGRIKFICADLRDENACRNACQEIDTVFHLAALGSVPRSIDDPVTTNSVNVAGTLNILRAAHESGVRRVVVSSSSSVYGNTPEMPKRENMRPSPCSPYAVSKLAGEEYSKVFFQTYGLETVVLRYFNVFGPRQRFDSAYAAVIPKFCRALLEGAPPVIYGDGAQSRDFTYVDNVVRANLLAADASDVGGEVFNIACGESTSVRQVLKGLCQLLSRSCEPQREPDRPGEVRNSRADIGRAWERLGYAPVIRFREGLKRTAAWYEAQIGEVGATPSEPRHAVALAAQRTVPYGS